MERESQNSISNIFLKKGLIICHKEPNILILLFYIWNITDETPTFVMKKQTDPYADFLT